MLAILTAIKNSKTIIIAVLFCLLAVLLGIQTLRIQHIKLEYEKDKVAFYEKMIAAQKEHEKRLENISKETGVIARKIQSMKLEKERCQNDEFYKVANDIVKRFND